MIDKRTKDMLTHYNQGLELYKSKSFKEAVSSFKKALEIKPEDGPSKLYLERCQVLIKDPPPEDWDGVFTMTTK